MSHPVGSLKLKDRLLGCLLGGALGDAWGGPYEGRSGEVLFSIPARSKLSDDTQLILATCESIIEHGRVDPGNVASHFIRWFLDGRVRGIGSSTLKAMRDLAAGTHWALAGARGERAAGNGAAMRIAPLAFVLDPTDSRDRVVIRDICRITHHNDEAYVGALAVMLAIHSVLSGAWSSHRTFLAAAADGLPDSAVRDRIRALLPLRLSPSDVAHTFGATGHVVDTVPIALYCAQAVETEPLPAVLSKTISGGGDTDTIASITGHLAGTVTGLAGVPREFLAAVDGSDHVSAVAERFAEFVERK